MAKKYPSELNTRTIRIGLGDYALLTDISRRAGVSIAEALPMALHKLETRPEAPGSPLQIPLLPEVVTPVINESHYEQDLDEETARLNDSIAQLEERKTFLESPGYNNEIIQKFLRDINRDDFYMIGIKLGLLECAEATPEDLEGVEGAEPVEVALGDKQFLRVTKEKPEDMTGWAFSENQGLYIKVERRKE